MIFNGRKKNTPDSTGILYQINSKDLEITSSYTHIGVERNIEHGPVSDAAIATARRHFIHSWVWDYMDTTESIQRWDKDVEYLCETQDAIWP